MDSYNLTNGLHMSQNKYLLVDVVKKEWGFDGLIMSDWSATYDGIEATNGGRTRDAFRCLHERKVLLPAIEGQLSRDNRRQGASHPARRGALWLARSRSDRFGSARYNLQGRRGLSTRHVKASRC